MRLVLSWNIVELTKYPPKIHLPRCFWSLLPPHKLTVAIGIAWHYIFLPGIHMWHYFFQIAARKGGGRWRISVHTIPHFISTNLPQEHQTDPWVLFLFELAGWRWMEGSRWRWLQLFERQIAFPTKTPTFSAEKNPDELVAHFGCFWSQAEG